MKLIVGLGNPGRRYENTRHNIGFKIVDQLANKLMIPINKAKFESLYSLSHINGERIILLKPLTFMNLSGQAVRAVVDFYNIDNNNILVIYDDLDLPVGKIRLRKKGGAGGHNGMKSIITHLGTEEFKRIRVGIDRPQSGMAVTDYVLAPFSKDQLIELDHVIPHCVSACEQWLTRPFSEVMNNFN